MPWRFGAPEPIGAASDIEGVSCDLKRSRSFIRASMIRARFDSSSMARNLARRRARANRSSKIGRSSCRPSRTERDFIASRPIVEDASDDDSGEAENLYPSIAHTERARLDGSDISIGAARGLKRDEGRARVKRGSRARITCTVVLARAFR